MNKLTLFATVWLGVCMPATAQTCNNTIPKSTPTAAFIDNNDGTMTHRKTGLTWMRCALGQSWDGSTCLGVASTYTWQNALKASVQFNTSGGYAGKRDWRVPNIKELSSIAERRCVNPSINAKIFPRTPYITANGFFVGFWSASHTPTDTFGTNAAWLIYFDQGANNQDSKGGNHFVRLVRGGQ